MQWSIKTTRWSLNGEYNPPVSLSSPQLQVSKKGKADGSTDEQLGTGRRSRGRRIRQDWSDPEETLTRREACCNMCCNGNWQDFYITRSLTQFTFEQC